MTRMPRPLDPVIDAIHAAQSVALVAHVTPDGDTVGSVLALCHGLRAMDRQVSLFCQDKIPDNLLFLKGAQEFRKPETLAEGEHFDLLLFADVSDESRMGSCIRLLKCAAHTAQVDHHGTNPNFCEANCVDGAATACALLAKELLERLGCTLTKDVATCLYVGLVTDSGQFSFQNTSDEAFDAMGDLMRTGFDVTDAHRRIYREMDPRQVMLLGRALTSMAFHRDGQIVSMKVTHKDMLECNALPEHTESIVQHGLDMMGVRMCVFARELDGEGTVKCSLRAVSPYAVDGIALQYSGGGHALAAGCTIHLPIDEAIREVVARMDAELEKHA